MHAAQLASLKHLMREAIRNAIRRHQRASGVLTPHLLDGGGERREDSKHHAQPERLMQQQIEEINESLVKKLRQVKGRARAATEGVAAMRGLDVQHQGETRRWVACSDALRCT